VALMHSTMSERQASLVHRLQVNVVLFLDNDPAGKEGTRRIARELRKQQPGVYIAQYPYVDDCQPDDLTPEQVVTSIQGAKPYPIWERENKS
jgi:DNA primase